MLLNFQHSVTTQKTVQICFLRSIVAYREDKLLELHISLFFFVIISSPRYLSGPLPALTAV